MKGFISADIEGIASTVLWDECRPEKPGYAAAYYHVPTVYQM